ncbi:biotin--[acetyl-CoA-carboxylase] ligase [Candidatus Contendibacter odensensis]|uniref:BPL/LPL catalytic domain-containing protein n=1 Tax=Candidatus Contendobacter odensis Run_B_J11 TaxID=1400861 RepID=A0A7U7J269_9GAMM|nr:hypothetical protein [Candidatus Contendobacter odensis]CDH43103.1 hypothetical protein BN874_1010010 [Candidatus Contendobacter odensis Run_B_J11]
MPEVLFLTDRPETTAVFLPDGATWSPYSIDPLSTADRQLWCLLAGAASCWRCEIAGTDAWPARRVMLIDRASASQFEALQAILRDRQELPDGLIALALEGSGFVGQRQRGWTALRGNLHLTAHYRLDLPAARIEADLMMLPTVAAADAIRQTSAGRCAPTIKWINDLMLPTGKVAGVLTATQIEGDQVINALFGIGINIEQAPMLDPSPFAPGAAALTDFDPGLRGSLPGLFAALVAALDAGVQALRKQNSSNLYAQYRALSLCIGGDVRLWPASCQDLSHTPPMAQGRVLDIRPDLSLMLEGLDEPIRNARLVLLPPDDSPVK